MSNGTLELPTYAAPEGLDPDGSLAGVDVGHTEKNRLLPLGVTVEIRDDNCEVYFLSGGVC